MEHALINPHDIIIGERVRKDLGDIEGLKHSIQEHGLLQPIGITRSKVLVYGGRRLQAFKDLNRDTIPCVFVDTEDALVKKALELEENLKRKDLLWPEEVRGVKELHELKLAIHGERPRGRPRGNLLESNKLSEGWTQEKTADLLDKSQTLVSQDLRLAEALDFYPELEKVSTKSAAKRALRVMMLRPSFNPQESSPAVVGRVIRLPGDPLIDPDIENDLGFLLPEPVKIALTVFCRERAVEYPVVVRRFIEERLQDLGFL